MSASGGWTIRRLSGTVEELHGLNPDPDVGREVWLMSPGNSALVLGSAQPEEAASKAITDGPAVVRRRSAGGAVLVVPEDTVWIDIVISRSDPLWEDDVNRAPMWLGRVWTAALVQLGVDHGVVLDRYEPGPWGRLACFASHGPGEVLVSGSKAVGITQRRTRATARFQTLLYRQWDPEELFACLAESSEQLRNALLSAVRPVDAHPEEIRSAFLACLP